MLGVVFSCWHNFFVICSNIQCNLLLTPMLISCAHIEVCNTMEKRVYILFHQQVQCGNITAATCMSIHYKNTRSPSTLLEIKCLQSSKKSSVQDLSTKFLVIHTSAFGISPIYFSPSPLHIVGVDSLLLLFLWSILCQYESPWAQRLI